MESVRLKRHEPHQIYTLSDGSRVVGASTVAGINKPVGPLMGWAVKMHKQGIDYRKFTDDAADIGMIAHFMAQCHLTGKMADLEEFTTCEIALARVAFDKFVDFWDKNKMEVIDVEVQLVSEKYRYGGTIDLIAFDHKHQHGVVWDWKTSKSIYESHLFQVAGYFQLWNETSKLLKAERASICRVGREEGDDFQIKRIPKAKMPLYWNCFLARLAVYNSDRALKYG